MAHLKQSAKYYRISNLSALTEQWVEEVSGFNSKKRNYKELNKLLSEKEQLADDVVSILSLQDLFTYENFRRKFLGEGNDTGSILKAFEKKIATLNKNKQFGNALVYEESYRSFKKHFTRDITFKEIVNLANSLKFHFQNIGMYLSKPIAHELPNYQRFY